MMLFQRTGSPLREPPSKTSRLFNALIAATTTRHLQVVRHVRWEGPHRILDAFPDFPIDVLDILESGTRLPEVDSIAGAVVMGGPMSANDTDSHPRLAEEVAWLGQCAARGVPVLGVCLGAQLLARALGGTVAPAPAREIGFAPVEIMTRADPVVGPLAPTAVVLHWHGEIFDLPANARLLARSTATEVQAFRAATAWGLLFHAEADTALIEQWLGQPTMADEARSALGSGYAETLRAAAGDVDLDRTSAVFAAFANECRA
jgi:GMP synthase (glutamine-hydrolysing)